VRYCTFLPVFVVLAVVEPPRGAGPTAEPAAGRHRPLAVEDLYAFESMRNPVLAPDGDNAVCVRQWIDRRTRQERSSLWLLKNTRDKREALEAGEPDGRAPTFSPDGKWVAFLSTRSRPDGWRQTPPAPPQSDPATDVWLIPAAGGAAVPLAGPEKPYGRVFNDGFFGRLAFSPDGKRLAFVADDGRPPTTDEEANAGAEHVRDDQGEGYTGYGTPRVWVADLDTNPGGHAASRIDRLTGDEVWYGDPHWSPDGRTLVVHANKTTDRESVRFSINKDYDLYAIDVRTKGQTRLTTGPGPEVSPRFAPDGKRIACLSVPRKGSHRDAFNLAVVTLAEGGARVETLFDHHGPGADRPPHPAPVFPLPEDCWDGNGYLVYHAEAGVRTEAVRVELASGRGELLRGAGVKPGRDSVAGRIRRRQELQPDNPFPRDVVLGASRVVNWENEGLKLEGILTTPPQGVAKAPYRLLVYPHGGPHSRSALGPDFTAQTFAAQGYAVFQPNFRGSSGYGQKFIDADRGDFGGGDMRDILSGIDELVRQKLVDRERQFLYGASYGGFMTCWLVGHTNQFRAAVAQNAVTDLSMMWALSDLKSWVEWEFGGRPWEVPEELRRHSPLTSAAGVRTPTLVLHSRDDRRCPLPMGRAFHEVLKANGVPTEMVVYPGEGHGVRQPGHREDVLRRTLAWFERFDKK
jgi:dipeptidyl aminopeptidase/acylaminoacyl peptidase